MTRSNMHLPLLCLIFLLSGAAGLIFETLWFRGAGLSFGNSVWAGSITLAAYMGGLALGNALAGRLGRRVRNPVRAYAVLELLIGVTGLLLVPLLPALAGVLAPVLGAFDDSLWWSAPLRLTTVFLLLMIPTTAMGATLPLLVMALCREKAGFGKALGYLYGFNTLGAMAGAVVGEVYLVQAFGLLGTGFCAAALNILAAGLSLLLMTRTTTGRLALPVDAPRRVAHIRYPWRVWLMLLASALAGGALLGAEVLWFRFLRLFFLDTDATFVIMLAVVLAGIALGGLLAGAALSRWPQRHDLALGAAALCGVTFAASYSVFDPGIAGTKWHIDRGSIAQISFLLMFPTALASGALFTFLGQSIHSIIRSDVEAAAALTTANTTGAMLGALLAAFVLLPHLGVEGAIWALTWVYCAAFACLAATLSLPRDNLLRGMLASSVITLAAAMALFPFGQMQAHLDAASEKFRTADGSHTVAAHEGLTETLQYLQTDWLGQPVSHALMTNGFSMSDSKPGSRRYMSLYTWWSVALHPKLDTALLISYGIGNTAKSLTQWSALREIDIVDISRDIIAHADVTYPGATNPLKDPRVRVHIEDGRFFLQATKQRFDLITSEPPPPRAPGVISLYTEEYFRLIRDRLTEGGLVTYWLPVHNMTAGDARAILKGFCNAFDDCGLWGGYGKNWMMTGSRNATATVPLAQFTTQWRDPIVLPTLLELGLERPELLGTAFMADAQQLKALLATTLPLTDNFPKRYSQGFPTAIDDQFYSSWMEPQRTRAQFMSSAWISRFWPPVLREASLDYFVVHQAVNEPEQVIERGQRLQMIAETLRHPGLKTPVLWLLGTSPRHVDIARATDKPGNRGDHKNPDVAYVLGAAALANNDVAAAADHFETALTGGDKRALAPLLFCACRNGQAERAQRIAATHDAGTIRNSLARCW